MAIITNYPNAYKDIVTKRSMGYRLETAIADLIDNSITANASNIQITFFWDEKGYHWIAIRDNGDGFSDMDEFLEALKFASEVERASDDLGAFGYGLKTASLSIGKRLTVMTCNGEETNTLVLDVESQKKHPYSNQDTCFQEEERIIEQYGLAPDSGTLVLISCIDSLSTGYSQELTRAEMASKTEEVSLHLGMIFHRFIEGKVKGKELEIYASMDATRMNLIESWNPFSERIVQNYQPVGWLHPSREEDIPVKGYICKHHSRFSSVEELEWAGGPYGWLESQGFYVYRNDRLIVHGDWLGLSHQGRRIGKLRYSQLVRISLDLPSSLDKHWKLDIMKTRALPPAIEKPRLEGKVGHLLKKGHSVYANRAGIAPTVDAADQEARLLEAWQRFQSPTGAITYKINTRHILLERFLNSLGTRSDKKSFTKILKEIENGLPLPSIKFDIHAENELDQRNSESVDREMVRALMSNLNLTEEEAITRLNNHYHE
jgi:hypothetical protein